ncbi:MAG: sulfite exporter TauE/SafE family protein [Xanthomonadales bacterium]|nr:sulfite exporter TauE/SafE family protein [Xanthomonadales bacterium]
MNSRRRLFWAWLGAFYLTWGGILVFGGLGPTALTHWPIAVAMAAGSYVAGSTPMGGGTVGFPILVLLFDQPASLGRDFSFAVQAVGMTSAALFIWSRRQPLEWPMLRAALIGALIGTPLGIIFVAPLVSGLFIKLLFAVVWASFGLLHLHRINEITAHQGITPTNLRFDTMTGAIVGFVGGLTIASITGVGIDMLLYMVLVLVCHADLRIAIPTSVILMAFVSVVGLFTKLLLGTIEPGVWPNWLAAAPVVAIGAPFGALVVSRIGRRPTLLVVSVLCVAQFGWTLWHERQALSPWTIAATLLGVILFLLVFQELHRLGDRLARRRPD